MWLRCVVLVRAVVARKLRWRGSPLLDEAGAGLPLVLVARTADGETGAGLQMLEGAGTAVGEAGAGLQKLEGAGTVAEAGAGKV